MRLDKELVASIVSMKSLSFLSASASKYFVMSYTVQSYLLGLDVLDVNKIPSTPLVD